MQEFLRVYWQHIKELPKNIGAWFIILMVLAQNRTPMSKALAIIVLILVVPLFQPWPEVKE
jgi:hypothetical protein